MEKSDFIDLNKENDGWKLLEDNWTDQCKEFDENIDDFATASLPVLKEIVVGNSKDHAVFALRDKDGVFHALCCLNSVLIPGYKGHVLRVRHVLLSPQFDYGDLTIDDYAEVLTEVFYGALEISNGVMRSDHIKFHFRSPADRSFFAAVGKNLNESKLFDSVKFRGAWLYLDKAV